MTYSASDLSVAVAGGAYDYYIKCLLSLSLKADNIMRLQVTQHQQSYVSKPA